MAMVDSRDGATDKTYLEPLWLTTPHSDQEAWAFS
jgi:hypothetical protein